MPQENKILVIDDELSVCKGCKRIFEEEGWSVKTALSGKEGLDKAREESFDVIVVDFKMPDISGMEVIRNVKQEQPDVVTIMITGYASIPSATEAIKLGAEDYLPKPFTPDEINLVVEKAIGKKEVVEASIISKGEILKVLNRAAEDDKFWAELIESGSNALKNYRLSNSAKAAIISGDIKWIEEHAGKLNEKELQYLRHRLEAERW